MCFSTASHADLESDQNSYDEMMGISASDAMNAGIGVSMMGWGLAIIIGITILCLVLHQSRGSNAHGGGNSTSGTTGSTGNSGLGDAGI
ncbi:MAG: hypothetical protein S4CHLAM37_03800 [Chlamydiia bacterium]|nr:hypothetical protein [Chlamydiia bacterium]